MGQDGQGIPGNPRAWRQTSAAKPSCAGGRNEHEQRDVARAGCWHRACRAYARGARMLAATYMRCGRFTSMAFMNGVKRCLMVASRRHMDNAGISARQRAPAHMPRVSGDVAARHARAHARVAALHFAALWRRRWRKRWRSAPNEQYRTITKTATAPAFARAAGCWPAAAAVAYAQRHL